MENAKVTIPQLLLGVIAAIAVFAFLCIYLPIILWKQTLPADTIFRILSLLFSWPVTILIVALIFLSRFQSAIDYFLRNVRRINFPGGDVQLQQQTETKSSDISVPPGSMVITSEQQEQISRYIQDLQQQHSNTVVEKQNLKEQLRQVYMESIAWKFSYLNLFYVPQTKQVLFWFAHSSPQTRQSYDTAWQPSIQDNNQRIVILDVLLNFNMLKADGVNITITTEGHNFLQFIGMIPRPPAET